MAGILTPPAAYELVRALKQEIGLPIHLHTHDSAGSGVATVLRAAEAGLDLADGALSSMAGGTSQPSLNAIVAGLRGTERQSALDLSRLEPLSEYWSDVRELYGAFETGIAAPDASVYRHQMPGGQYTNLRQQAEAVGLGGRWREVVDAYREADAALGEVIKVTPSSKAVGDFALFMVQNEIAPHELMERLQDLDAPRSVIEMLAGGLGQPPYPFAMDLQQAILKGREPIQERPGALLEDADLNARAAELLAALGRKPSNRDVICSLIYPDAFLSYQQHVEEFSDTACLDTPTFLYGLNPGETAYAEIEQGKTLIISMTALGPLQDDGTRVVYFDLNGNPREIEARDLRVAGSVVLRLKADPNDWRQVAAPMPGTVVQVAPAPGERVKRGDQLLVIEAMKMETVITAPRDALVVETLARAGESVQPGDLLVRLEDVAG
jgi:pyruvate carboxylase